MGIAGVLQAEPYEFRPQNGGDAASASIITSRSPLIITCVPAPSFQPEPRMNARLTARTVEIFLKGERIAVHVRASGNHKDTTAVSEHMPSSHRRYAGSTMERIRADARLIGPATAALCELILHKRPHPEQGFRACLGSDSGSRAPIGPSVWKPPPNAPSTSARGPRARSNPSSTTTLTGVLRASAPRTERRSCTPTSVARATTIRRDDLLKHPTLDQLNALGLHGMAKALRRRNRRQRSSRRARPSRMAQGFCSIARRPRGRTSASRRGCASAELRQQASVEDVVQGSPRRS